MNDIEKLLPAIPIVIAIAGFALLVKRSKRAEKNKSDDDFG